MRNGRANHLEKGLALFRARANWKHPVYLIHAVTARCNASCEFCAWKYSGDSDAELTTEEIKRLYRDARRSGFFWLSLWGGEPLVHRDIGEIAQHAHRLGFATNMVTNGFLLERKMDEVVPFVDRICISVDHPSEKHDEIRGVKGLYERIINTTKKLRRKYPQKTVLYIYTMFKKNIDPASVKKMAELTRTMRVVGVFNPLRDEAASEASGDIDLKQFIASDEELSESFKLLRRLKKHGYPILNSYTYINKLIKGHPKYHCHWPKFIMPIEANGDVVDCMFWGKRTIDNVRDKRFSAILKNPRLRELAGEDGEGCSKCVSLHRVEISEICEGNLEPLLSWARAML